ncbi:MAG: c-type cytochrome, partial [Bacteroidota bacterium]
MKSHLLPLIVLVLLFQSCQPANDNTYNWSAYLGDKHSSQYAPLDQINVENVDQLEVAWKYASGDADLEKNRTQIQCNPLIINGVLYGSSPKLKFFALDATTGEELWVFDPFAANGYQQYGMGVNRGLTYWENGDQKRILVTAGDQLYSIDANTGLLDPQFGKEGQVSLRDGLDRDIADLFIVANTPGVIYENLLVLGSRVSEGEGAAPGHIRAINVRTGEQAWIFHTIPWPGEFGAETWPDGAWQYAGGANSWAGLSLDEERGIVFVPTGSAAWDFYGSDRKGENLFANCLIALDVKTGERIWHYQFIHHDLWDRDLPAAPNLVTLNKDGKNIDAVAQITKSAYVFIFDRETGEPIYPIEEQPVPPSKLIGEEAWPTQPLPSAPPAFSRNRFTADDITQRTPEAYAEIKARLDTLDEGANFIPPSENGAIIFPGLDGGGEWGGAAFDEESGNLIVNASEMPWVLQMVKHAEAGPELSLGKKLYQSYCLTCHGENLEGGDLFGKVPALVNVKERLGSAQVIETIQKGKGVMPSFSFIDNQQAKAIADFILEIESNENASDIEAKGNKYPYYFNGYQRFKDSEGFPAITPPWGTLNAVNLNTGTISWKVTLG